MTTTPKDAFDASHAGTLIIGGQNLFLLLFGVATTRFENAAFAAVLAPKLLAATALVSVLDYV
jgi:hypothetical protein